MIASYVVVLFEAVRQQNGRWGPPSQCLPCRQYGPAHSKTAEPSLTVTEIAYLEHACFHIGQLLDVEI